MTKDPAKRLGYKHGDLPEHMFYRRVDWDKLGRREVQPPYKPPIVSADIDLLYIRYTCTLQCSLFTVVDKYLRGTPTKPMMSIKYVSNYQ